MKLDSEQTDEKCVDQASRQLYIGNTGTVEFDLDLPVQGALGTHISWASSDGRWIETDGTVHQPEYGRGDRDVRLTATIVKGRAERQRFFDVKVLQLPNRIEVERVYPMHLRAQKGSVYNLPMFTAVLAADGRCLSQKIDWDEDVEQCSDNPGEHIFHGTIDGSSIAVQCRVEITEYDPLEAVDSHPLLTPIPIGDVRLTGDGILAGNQRRRIEFLKTLDDDQLLVEFRKASGLDTKGAEPMIGWDAPDSLLRGHTTGHVLSAYALGYAASGEEALRRKLTYLVDGLAEVQKAFEADPETKPGFLSAYSEKQFDQLETYTPYPTIWAPYYTLHKILAGLIDAYEYAGDKTALRVASDLGDWVYARVHRLPHEQLQNMWSMYIAGEFGGMNESLARLHAFTGKPEHLAAARLFDNDRLMVPMRQKVDALGGLHANQHIPQVIGSVELYRQTGLPYYLDQAEFFLRSVIAHHVYVMGGTGQGEMFQQPDVIGTLLRDNTAESCASYNLLKLAALLFSFDPDTLYSDYIELTTINHIAASTDHVPQGGSLYFFPTQPGGRKEFDVENSCCHGTGLESHFYYANGAFYTNADTLSIQQYPSCRVDDPAGGIDFSVSAEDRHPDKVDIRLNHLERANIALRIPAWSRGQVRLTVNGEALDLRGEGRAQTTIVLDKALCGVPSWDGVRIGLRFAPSIHLVGTPDWPDLVSVMWGPYVLAALSDSKETLQLAIDRQDPERSFRREKDQLVFVHKPTGLTFVPLPMITQERYHMYVCVQQY